jgi:hypothetical protein
LGGKQEGIEWKQNVLGSWKSELINQARREIITII